MHVLRLRFPGGLVVENPPTNAGDTGDLGSIPGWGRFLGGGNGSPLQYSCLENPMYRRAWWATVHGIARVRHDLWTKPTPSRIYRLKVRKRKPVCNALEQAE